MNKTVIAMLLLAATPAWAQSLDTIVTVSSGSGLSIGTGDGDVVRARSPIFLEFDVGLIFDDDYQMEWTPSLILELDGRVSVGINPSLKRVLSLSPRWAIYGGVGLPFFFAPFTLIGAEAAVGGFFNITPRFAAVVELRTDVFFAGSDLPDGGVLAKLDLAVGIRFDL